MNKAELLERPGGAVVSAEAAVAAGYHPELRSAPFAPGTFVGMLVYAVKVDALTYKRNPAG